MIQSLKPNNFAQIALPEQSSTNARVTEVCAGQFGVEEVSLKKVCATEVCTTKISKMESSSAETCIITIRSG